MAKKKKTHNMKEAEYNPRYITEEGFDKLRQNLKELGDLSGIVHDQNSDFIISGNQRSKVFDINDCEIEITKEYKTPTDTGTTALGYVLWEGERFAYRRVDWTPEQCKKANVTANKLGGNWDWDVLANSFDTGELLDWGFSEFELFGEDGDPEEEEEQEKYTGKIEAPSYTPKNEKPALSQLIDKEKAEKLQKKIRDLDIPADIKDFLILASSRHYVFHYDRIADYYAHSPKKIQEIMEDLALVIIDFDKAIELGYVQLNEELANQYAKEQEQENDEE